MFSYNNAPSNASSTQGSVREAADIQDIETDDLGLPQVEVVSGDKLKFFPQPWPADQLPPATASLLSIASNKGLLAAAGPDSLVVVRTEELRRQYIPRRRKRDETAGLTEDEPKIKPLVPDASIEIPRVSHVTFSADESCLVIVAEQGGGLAVYDTSALSTGAKPAFQLGTNGTSVRQLLPNPSAAPDLAHFFGIVLANGQLLLADLKERKIVATETGSPVFHENVHCAAWSKLGKQIVAGLEDGTAVQLDRNGTVKDRIPQPPQLPQLRQNIYDAAIALPLTAIAWLSNHEFLLIYSPSNPPPGDDMPPTDDSAYFFALRDPKQNSWTFRRLAVDPCTAFVQHRARPAGHFIQRLSEWPPKLKDLLILASSASVDIGVLSHSQTPDEFATTIIKDDSRRPTIPMSASDEDTTPVGVAIDLSAKELAPKPVPSQVDVIEEAPGPVPALCIINTEGVLSMWWVIYNDSIRQSMPYPGIVNKAGPYRSYSSFSAEQPATTRAAGTQGFLSATATQSSPQASKLSAQPSLFASTSSSTFPASSSAQQPAFGKPAFSATSTSAFGGTSTLGQSQSPWGSATNNASAVPSSTFGKPSFGSATPMASGSAFGQVGGMGANKASLWGAPTTSQAASPQAQSSGSGFSNTAANSPFAAFGSTASTASPFAAFSTSNNKSNSTSPFAAAGQKPQVSPFSTSGQTAQSSPFASAGKQPSGLSKELSMGSTATLGSTASSFSFGNASAFQGSALGTASAHDSASFISKPTMSKEATMEDESSSATNQQAGGLLGLGNSGFKLGSIFKTDGSAKDDLPKPETPGAGLFGANFGSALSSTRDEVKEPERPSGHGQKEQANNTKPLFGEVKPSQPLRAPTPVSRQAAETAPEPAPLPPAWSASKPTPQGIPEDAPLPPFPPGKANNSSDSEPPLAGSPPVDLGNEKFSSAAGSVKTGPDEDDWESEDESDEDGDEGIGEEDDEDDDDEDDDDDDSEQDAEDDNENDDESQAEQKPFKAENPQALDAFMSRLQPPETRASKPQTLSTTPPSSAKPTYTPAGHPPHLRNGPVFPPPAAEPLRSPSPARGGFRSVTSPVGKVTIGPLPAQIKQGSIPPAPPVQRPAPATKPQEPDAEQLEDEADARMQAILNAPIEPSKDLPLFYTHQDYAGTVEKPGFAGQIEKVYRDVNSMIDVLGLNARSLASFVEGHGKPLQPDQRTRDDLEDGDGWALGEIGSLSTVIAQLNQQLENGRLQNARSTVQELRDDEKDVYKIKAKTVEIKKLVAARTDPDHLALQEAAPLPADLMVRQAELRQGVQKVQNLLSEVEGKMTLLRADLVSSSNAEKTPHGTRAKVPTVEAITRTIQKMTAMVQERSGDIDVLESQIRQLPDGISAATLTDDYEDDLVSRLGHHRLISTASDGSPLRATPSPRRSRMAANGDALGASGMFSIAAAASNSSRYATPPGSARRSHAIFSPGASALAQSTGSLGDSTRKKMVHVTAAEVRDYNAKLDRRRAVLEALKSRVENKGTRIVKVE